MKKISLVALAALIASASVAPAQSFDVNAMPLSNIPAATDTAATGSIGAQLHKRIIVRNGQTVTQFYTVGDNGDIKIVSEEKN